MSTASLIAFWLLSAIFAKLMSSTAIVRSVRRGMHWEQKNGVCAIEIGKMSLG